MVVIIGACEYEPGSVSGLLVVGSNGCRKGAELSAMLWARIDLMTEMAICQNFKPLLIRQAGVSGWPQKVKFKSR